MSTAQDPAAPGVPGGYAHGLHDPVRNVFWSHRGGGKWQKTRPAPLTDAEIRAGAGSSTPSIPPSLPTASGSHGASRASGATLATVSALPREASLTPEEASALRASVTASRAAAAAVSEGIPEEDSAMDDDAVPVFEEAEIAELNSLGFDQYEWFRKMDGASNLDQLIGTLPVDYRRVIADRLRIFRKLQEKRASARASLERNRAHKRHKTFPSYLNSLSMPTLLFQDEFKASKAASTFTAVVGDTLNKAKIAILEAAIISKEEEVKHYEKLCSVDDEASSLSSAIHRQKRTLLNIFPTMSGAADTTTVSAIRGRIEKEATMLAQGIYILLNRVAAMAASQEDARLANTLAKMDLASEAKDKAPGHQSKMEVDAGEAIARRLEARFNRLEAKLTVGSSSKQQPNKKGGKAGQKPNQQRKGPQAKKTAPANNRKKAAAVQNAKQKQKARNSSGKGGKKPKQKGGRAGGK